MDRGPRVQTHANVLAGWELAMNVGEKVKTINLKWLLDGIQSSDYRFEHLSVWERTRLFARSQRPNPEFENFIGLLECLSSLLRQKAVCCTSRVPTKTQISPSPTGL